MKHFFTVVGFVAFGASVPAQAQEFIGEVGACVIEDASGAVANWNSCKRLPANCTPESCEIGFLWQDQQTMTLIEMPTGIAAVADGTAMNGQEAYAPAALRDSDPRDCIYNAVSDAVFCWVPGVDAFTVAAGQMGDIALLKEIALEAKGVAMDPLLARLQGRYIPFPTWSCEATGGEGGALEIRGDVFYGVETACTLLNPQAIGQHGAVMFDVTCEGEGETWSDEYIFKLDEWGRLGWMSADQVSVMEACQ